MKKVWARKTWLLDGSNDKVHRLIPDVELKK